MKKILFLFVMLLFAASISQGANWYVDPLGTDDVSHGTTTGAGAFLTIQYAINSAAENDVITVAAGTYDEQVHITKALTLQGAGATTIIKPSVGKLTQMGGTSPNTFTGIILASPNGANVIIKNLKVDGDLLTGTVPAKRNAGISCVDAGGIIDNVTVANCLNLSGTGSSYWDGILATTWNITPLSIEIKYCTVQNSGGNNIILKENTETHLTGNVHHNTITGRGEQIQILQNGIQFYFGVSGTISYNTISNVTWGLWPGDGWSSSGILTIFPDVSVSISHNTISSADCGIDGAGTLDINNNTINIVDVGIGTEGGNSTVTIDHNTITAANEQGISLLTYGVTETINATITNNTVTNTGGVKCGIALQQKFANIASAAPFNGILNAEISGNTISGFADGILVGEYSDIVIVHNNNLNANSAYGVKNEMTTIVSATNNYWGSSSGPYHATTNPCGTGNAVSDNVTFTPFWGNEGMTIPGYYSVYNLTKSVYYCSIQTAIDAASANDVIQVGAGTYSEQLTITKSLSLIGAGLATTKILAPAARTLNVTNSTTIWDYVVAAYATTGTINVKIEGLTIDADGKNKTSGTARFAGLFLRDVSGTGSGFYSSKIMNFGADAYNWGIIVYGNSTTTINGNDVAGYTTNGITANGDDGSAIDPNVIISNNIVTGTSVCYNAVQIGYGATGSISGNSIQDHTSTTGAGVGILIWESNDVTINNSNSISNCWYGLDVVNSNGATISNNTLTDIKSNAIMLDNSDNDQVTGNTIKNLPTTADQGIYLINGSTGNVIGASGHPNTITLPSSGTGQLYCINVSNSIGSGSNTIAYNSVTGGKRSIMIEPGGTGTTTVDHNTFSNTEWAGININSGSAVITNNTLANTVRPIEFWGAANVTIQDNTISASTYGAINAGSTSGTINISRNHIYDCGLSGGAYTQDGITLRPDADNAVVECNQIDYCYNGIKIESGSTGHAITNNNIHHNDWSGITAIEALGTVTGNTIDNCWRGIEAYSTLTAHSNIFTNNAYGSVIFHNDFARDVTGNWWGNAAGPSAYLNGTNLNTYKPDDQLEYIQANSHSDFTFVPWLNSGTDNDGVTCGFQPASGTEFAPVYANSDGSTTKTEKYASIQAAVTATTLAYVNVTAGVYNENVSVPVSKPLTFKGQGGTAYIAAGKTLTLASDVTFVAFSPETSGTLIQINEGGKIQDGIDFAVAGFTVNVAAGTYPEFLNITSRTNITIKSTAGAATTIIQSRQTTGVNPAIYIHNSENITIDGFKITDVIRNSSGGIYSGAVGQPFVMAAILLTDSKLCTIKNNILFDFWYGAFIDGESTPDNSSGNVIKDNIIDGNDVAKIGVYIYRLDGAITTNTIVSGNTISKCYYGVLFNGDSDDLQVLNNTVTGSNDITFSYGGSPGYSYLDPPVAQGNGVGVYFWWGDEDILVQGNTITNFDKGVNVDFDSGDPTKAVVRNNKITGNLNYGVLNAFAATLKATNNYWGGDGPKDPTLFPSATGDAVSANVSFIPWWCNVEMSQVCPQLDPGKLIMNTNTGTQYTAAELGVALTAATTGQTLYVAEGTAEGTSVNIDGKIVYIIGTGIDGQSVFSGASPALEIYGDPSEGGTVNVDGITFTMPHPETDFPTILVKGTGSLFMRNCIIHEVVGYDQSCLKVEGTGTVDAGTTASHGNNHFVVHGAGDAIDNGNDVALPAEYNDWGSAKGPTIASNIGGDGAVITGTYPDQVDYSPWGGAPMTTAAAVTICAEATTVDIPITVTNFNDVGSFSLTFGYTPAELTAPTILSRNDAFTTKDWDAFEVTASPTGSYKVSGLGAETDDGISLDNGSTLFTLRFTIGTIATSATLAFDMTTGVACEYTGVAPSYPVYGDMASNYVNGSVTVNHVTSAGVIAGALTICSGDDPAAFTSTSAGTGDGAITYRWELNTNIATPSWGTIDGATSETYDAGALTADAQYRRVAISTLSGVACEDESNVLTVTVNNVTAGEIAGTQTICSGSDPAAFTSPTAGSGDQLPIAYRWELNTNLTTPSWGTIVGAESATYDAGALTADAQYRRIAISTLSAVACEVEGNVLTVTVNNVTAGAIQTAQTICSGFAPALLTTLTAATCDGTPSYQWQSSTTSATTDFSNILADGTSETYQPPALYANTWYRRVVTSTISGDPVTCDATSVAIAITVNARRIISGYFNYYNVMNTPLTAQNITVKLYATSDEDHETQLGSDVTDNSGFYQFTNLCPTCDYDIVATDVTTSTVGSVNTTDAAQVNYWFTHKYAIEKVRYFAGDGNRNNVINATDAQNIQLHFVNGTAFARGAWTFWNVDESTIADCAESYPHVTLVAGSDLEANMYGLCTGDFNRSFDPSGTKSASSTLDLIYAGNRLVSSNQEFDLPINMVNASGLGAVSLILNFPAEMVEVQDVIMDNTGGILDWAVKGNELRIGWNSSVPLDLSAGAELVTLRLKTTSAFTIGNSIRISLAANPLNELADNMYEVIGNAVLSIDAIEASAFGIDEQPVANQISMSNYPNPFSNYTTIIYTLPFEGKVTLEITSTLGNIVTTLVSETQTKGNHEVVFNTYDLPMGVYFATLKIKSAKDELIRTIKLVNNK